MVGNVGDLILFKVFNMSMSNFSTSVILFKYSSMRNTILSPRYNLIAHKRTITKIRSYIFPHEPPSLTGIPNKNKKTKPNYIILFLL